MELPIELLNKIYYYYHNLLFNNTLENIKSIELSRYIFYLNYKKYKIQQYNLRTIVFPYK
jgi:hypothetical protein